MSIWWYKDKSKTQLAELGLEKMMPANNRPPFKLRPGHPSWVLVGQETTKSSVQTGLAALMVCQVTKEVL
ncbi:hypothetical protein ColLi_11598 [Colletotrichum liriopes]|uniref:Uncharacterized protein n=1 Tax=Colletotrichum liriopes TaxID=708192 RepID=A0AA37GWS5_9PEZI|nr:hypothetical protein ColLi_11598 [Colletotrichum liriopes]